MEGPSLYLAAELLAPFIGNTIEEVEGNTRIGKERLFKKKILNIIYKKSTCPDCQGKVTRKKTGKRWRVSFFCPHCQN